MRKKSLKKQKPRAIWISFDSPTEKQCAAVLKMCFLKPYKSVTICAAAGKAAAFLHFFPSPRILIFYKGAVICLFFRLRPTKGKYA